METKITINGKDPYDCTKEEIFAAWDQLKEAYNIIKRRAAMNFRPGMRVYFDSKRGRRVYGTITKVNSSTITLREDDSIGTWKVSTTMLHKAE